MCEGLLRLNGRVRSVLWRRGPARLRWSIIGMPFCQVCSCLCGKCGVCVSVNKTLLFAMDSTSAQRSSSKLLPTTLEGRRASSRRQECLALRPAVPSGEDVAAVKRLWPHPALQKPEGHTNPR